MNTQQQALNLIKENGGSATREQINQLVQFTKTEPNEFYTSALCWKLVQRGFVKVDKNSPARGPETSYIITGAGKRYIKQGRKYSVGSESTSKFSNIGVAAPVSKAPTPVEKLISGSIIRDLLLNKFDQLSASERCGLLEIYNIVESKTKTQQQ